MASKTRMMVAQRIATPLHDLEKAIDQALADGGMLTSTMATGRREMRLAAEIGQRAFDNLGHALIALTAARRHVVDVHRALAAASVQIGLPPSNWGDEAEKMSDLTPAVRQLQSVA